MRDGLVFMCGVVRDVHVNGVHSWKGDRFGAEEMTQPEFEALQVGDIVASDQNDLAVMYDVTGEHEKRFVFQDDGIDGSIWHDELDDWSVVSRVLARENVNPVKGGE